MKNWHIRKKFLVIVSGLAVAFVVGLVTGLLVGLEGYPDRVQKTSSIRSSASSDDYITVNRLHNAVNKTRTSRGEARLKLDSTLNSSATAKCNDMKRKDYWSHKSPNGTLPWVFIEQYVWSYFKAGENLAYGHHTNNEVIIGWLVSKKHKENLLDPEFTHVGYGVCRSESYQGGRNTLVVQHFLTY